MGRFLEREKPLQTEFKMRSPYFSAAARKPGMYRSLEREFCLPRAHAAENLFEGIREDALAYFEDKGISWHNGREGEPSNHLCDSQVCGVNFLFPFVRRPQALVELLRSALPAIRSVLPMETEGQFVSFEWIGLCNYLGERMDRTDMRTRGANFTSADAAVMFERDDATRQIVLIEWKYTESYSPTPLRFSLRGTDRTQTYRPLFIHPDCPLDRNAVPHFEDLFYEPFYQLMRQQLLAHEMEKAGELGASAVSVLHIAPARNSDFTRVTSPALRDLGDSATNVWEGLLRAKDRFLSISTEQLFGRFDVSRFPELAPWWKYMSQRYPWVAG